MTGLIYKATGGFYYVRPEGSPDADGVECRPRGIFRKEGRKPLVGDRVEVSVQEDGSGAIEEILPRKNELIRPPLANLDYMTLVLSVTDPPPNRMVVDQLLAVLEHKGIEPLIAVTKGDLADPSEIAELYRGAGYDVYVMTAPGERERLIRRLSEGLSAFCGNTGAGKSSLLNLIGPELAIPVGDTSRKLGRGRHTTRHVELHRLPGSGSGRGGLVADTPGFTSLDIGRMSDMTAPELAGSFREFGPCLGRCRFQDCTHTCEAGCAVLEAVERGEIALSRHENYRQLYGGMKEVKEWERRS